MLNEANKEDTKIITVEDPVEYDLEGIVQIPVNEEIEVTYARVLRTILRQGPGHHPGRRDPRQRDRADRDRGEPHGPPRLLDAAHQRRALRDHAARGRRRRAVPADGDGPGRDGAAARPQDLPQVQDVLRAPDGVLRELGLSPAEVVGEKFAQGKGCEDCNFTGFRGRVALCEILVIDDRLRRADPREGQHQPALRSRQGIGDALAARGRLRAIHDGITTVEEVLRETMDRA
jgi:type IV pilus assembly protein PilB